jgi:hypothetical protein
MSLEQNIAELNTNIKALVAAMAAGGVASSASTGTAAAETSTGKTTTTGKGKAKDTAPKVSREEMVAALTEVKDKFGAAEAKAIIEATGAKKMAEVPDNKIASAFTAAQAKLAETDDNADDNADDGL